LGKEDLFVEEEVEVARRKLERSLAAKRNLLPGEVISESDLHLLSPGDGYQWADRNLLIGRTVTKMIPQDEIIYKDFLD